MEKLCIKCGQVGEFRKGRNVCKTCEAEYKKCYRAENPEKVKAARKIRYEVNCDKERTRGRCYREANIDKEKARHKRNYSAEYYNRWQKANPEKRKEIDKRYRKKNPDKRNALHHAYVARKRGNGGRYTAQEWKDLCNYYGNKCLCCGKTDVKLTVDHVNPIKLGGVNSIENIQPLCKHCNSSKGTKTIDYRW
jgi:5-methylcytosine-specific restriction endonuclease McrA